MKLTLLFLAASLAAVSISGMCAPTVMCKQHMVEAENTGREETAEGKCICIYEHVVDATSEVHKFKVYC